MSALPFIFGDIETHYSDDYTLRKLDPPSYILDPRFEAHLLGVCEGFTADAYSVEGPDIPKALAELGEDVAFVSHNALFDACILAWRYNWVPKLIVDTLGMANTLLHQLPSVSLENLGKHFGFHKGTMLAKVKNMNMAAIKANGLWEEYVDYNLDDTEDCRRVFMHLAPQLPPEEFVFHDMVLRCAIEPQFYADAARLRAYADKTIADKDKIFRRAMFAGLTDITELRSNDRFAELLQAMGVKPPRKISKTTGKLTWAFAKTDKEFLELLEHDDPRIQTLVDARLQHKSNIEVTRSERMCNIAQLTFQGNVEGQGWMPIPLKIGAAHTHRLGGGWKLNPQNWGRGSEIRDCIYVAEDEVVIVADAAQVEARFNAWFCGQWDLVEEFRRGEDVYSNFAATIYHVPVSKETEPAKRFVGKTGILQLGYQSGHDKFRHMVWLKSFETEPEPIVMTPQESEEVVDTFRLRYANIKGMWGKLKNMIPWMADKANIDRQYEMGPIIFTYQKIIGPNGLCLYYHDLRLDEDRQWKYTHRGGRYKLYGGKLLENCWASDTLVLTEVGWLPVVSVGNYRVWDGVEFVAHDGVVCRGEQRVICIDGIWCTPGHEILTDKGWRSASSCEGYHREPACVPDLHRLQRFGWTEVSMVDPLRLRHENRRTMVYDILNAGQRRRFVVAGETGPLITHNCIQFLARIALSQTALRLKPLMKVYNARLTHTTHDDIAYVIKRQDVDAVKALLHQEMSRTPLWAPGLPLKCDVGFGRTYGEAK